CGTIASQFIARGATIASSASDVTFKGAAQTDPRLIATNAGHQLFYRENGAAIYTQFVDNNAAPQARTQLTTFTFSYDATFLNGGSAIAWIDSVSNTVKVARYDQSGVKRGSTIEVPAVNMLINSISIAASGDTLLVAYQGT